MTQQNNNAAKREVFEPDPKAGQKPALDQRKRGRICGMVAMGASRREAARSVGCHVSTIARTMERDPQFATEVNEAELLCRQRPMRAMFDAVEKHWRAAAWMLERTRPDEFGRRRPRTYSHRHVRELVDRILEEVLARVTDEADRQQVRLVADKFIKELQHPPEVASEPVNPLVEWAKMDDELEEYKRQRDERRQVECEEQDE